MSTIQSNDTIMNNHVNKKNFDALLAEALLKFRPAHLMALYLLFVYFAIDSERDPVLHFIAQSTTSVGLMIPAYFWKQAILAACILIAIARPSPFMAFGFSAPLVIYGVYAFRYGVVTGVSPSVLTLMACGFVAALGFTLAVHGLIASEAERQRLLADNAQLAKQLSTLMLDTQTTPPNGLPKPTPAQLEQAK